MTRSQPVFRPTDGRSVSIADETLDPNLKRLQNAIREATAENTFTATEALRLDSEFTRAARTNEAGELVLDAEGFRNIMKRIGIKDASLIRGLFMQWDRDGSGELDFVEFLQSISLVLGGSSHDKLEQLFWVMDTNGDGRVSASELQVFYTNMFRMSGTVKSAGQVQEMVRRLFAAAKKDATYDTLGIEGALSAAVSPASRAHLICFAEFMVVAQRSRFIAGESLQDFMLSIAQKFAQGLRGAKLPRVDSSLPPPAAGSTPGALVNSWHMNEDGTVTAVQAAAPAVPPSTGTGAAAAAAEEEAEIVPPPSVDSAMLARQSSRAD